MYVLYFKLIYSYDVKIKLFIPHDSKKKIFGRAFKMIKTGGRNNHGWYGNTCCTILFLVVWAFYLYMVAGIWLLGILLLWKPDRELTDMLFSGLAIIMPNCE